MVEQWWQLVLGVVTSGAAVALLDQWRYRRRPALDVAALAQQIAAEAMAQAHADAEYHRDETAQLRSEAVGLRAELAAARAEIAGLRAELRIARASA